MNEAYRQWVQDLLDKAFKDTDLVPDDVQIVRGNATIIDFPRSLYCRCKKCTSPYVVLATLRWNYTLQTTKGEYHGWIPGPEDALAHPVQG